MDFLTKEENEAYNLYCDLEIFLQNKPKHIFIKKGQVLANLLFETDKKIKIKFEDDIKEIDLIDYYFSILKKLILPTRITSE